MYLKFDFNSSMPKEFGENVNKCVYYIDDKKISSVDPDEPFECIKNISKINFFVGANNSGKSRFLRGLMKLNHVSYKVSTSEKNIEFWIREINKWYEENHIKVYNMDNNIGNKINDIYVKLNITNTTYQNLVYNFSSNINIYNEVNSLKQEDRNRILRRVIVFHLVLLKILLNTYIILMNRMYLLDLSYMTRFLE